MHIRGNNLSAEGITYSNPYSSGRAIAGGFLLSAVLWWIPVIGPIVAGFYSGRRSGSFIKGVLSSAIAGGLLFAAIMAASHYILGPAGFPETSVEAAVGTLTGYFVWAGVYLEYFYQAGTATLDLLPLGVMIVFGGVGGSFSALHRKEAIALIANGAVHSAIRPIARSVELYDSGAELGFESFNDCISIKDSVMSFNVGCPSTKGRGREEKQVHTFQTNTTAVEGPSLTASAAQNPKDPFSNILAQTEVRTGSKRTVGK